MYKRILCALCFVFALLFIIAMLYLLLFYNQTKSQELKGKYVPYAPSISIYLDDLHDNSRVTISEGADKTVVIDRVERGLSYIGEKVKRKLLLFVCNASFPIQWKYNGFGSLQGTVNYRRDAPDFNAERNPNTTTYHYSTVIELQEISEYMTGYYECVGFKSIDPMSRVFVFAPEKNNNTFILSTEKEIEIDKYTRLVIPCPVSDPDAKVSLLRLVLPYEDGKIAKVEPQDKNAFDPKIGFRFKNVMTVEKEFTEAWGTYICQDEKSLQFSSIVSVVKPLATVASYFIDEVKDKSENRSFVRVTCSAKEDVYFNFYNFVSKKKRKVTHPKNDSHTIRVRIKQDDFTDESMIQCVTANSYRNLYTWQFKKYGILINGSLDIIIDYNMTTKIFSCCSKSNKSPTLKLLSCYTEAECQFKLNELKTDSYKNLEMIQKLASKTNDTCTEINVQQFPQGLLQCSIDKYTKQIPYYIDAETGQRRKKAPPEEGEDFIMRLQQKSTTKVKEGKQLKFHCSGPRFFVAQGFQWELKKHSGSSEYIKSNGTRNSVKDLQEWIEIILKDQQVSEVHCYAPVIGSPSQSLSISAVVNYTVFSSEDDYEF